MTLLTRLAEMESAALERGDRSLQLAALMARATLRSGPMTVRDPARAQALSEQALALARELGDRQAEAKILWNHIPTPELRASFLALPDVRRLFATR